MRTTLLSDEEIKKMREEIEANPKVSPPKGYEYWDAERIVSTLEYFQEIEEKYEKTIQVKDGLTMEDGGNIKLSQATISFPEYYCPKHGKVTEVLHITIDDSTTTYCLRCFEKFLRKNLPQIYKKEFIED